MRYPLFYSRLGRVLFLMPCVWLVCVSCSMGWTVGAFRSMFPVALSSCGCVGFGFALLVVVCLRGCSMSVSVVRGLGCGFRFCFFRVRYFFLRCFPIVGGLWLELFAFLFCWDAFYKNSLLVFARLRRVLVGVISRVRKLDFCI